MKGMRMEMQEEERAADGCAHSWVKKRRQNEGISARGERGGGHFFLSLLAVKKQGT